MSNEETNGNGSVPMSALAPLPEIEIDVQTLGDSNMSFKAYLSDYDAKTEREYQRVVNGGVRVRELRMKGLEDGRVFIFRTKFERTNIDWSNGDKEDKLAGLKAMGYETELEYFTKDKTGRRYLTPIVHQYFGIVSPDTSHTKE